jgi:hypothetical protein
MDKIVASLQITWGIVRNTYYRVIDALDIFWKGMLAIFLALGIIMVVIMLLNLVINKIETKKKAK